MSLDKATVHVLFFPKSVALRLANILTTIWLGKQMVRTTGRLSPGIRGQFPLTCCHVCYPCCGACQNIYRPCSALEGPMNTRRAGVFVSDH